MTHDVVAFVPLVADTVHYPITGGAQLLVGYKVSRKDKKKKKKGENLIFSRASHAFHLLLFSFLTSHGTEPEELVRVVVVGGAAPSHGVAAPVGGAVGVVAPTIEEGKVAQGSVRVSASCCNDDWIGKMTWVTYPISPCLLQIEGLHNC